MKENKMSEFQKELLESLQQTQFTIRKEIDRFGECYQKDRLRIACFKVTNAVTELLNELKHYEHSGAPINKKYGSS
jgi:hypothetical protein